MWSGQPYLDCPFDDVLVLDEAQARSVQLRKALAALAEANFAPVSVNQHVAALALILDEGWIDYEVAELKEVLEEAIGSSQIMVDQLGRVAATRSPNSSLAVVRARDGVTRSLGSLQDTSVPRETPCSRWSAERMATHPLLSPFKESRIALRAHQGLRGAINELVYHNVRLAANGTRHYTRMTGATDREDYLQEAILGVIRAAEKFDPSRGLRFSTYATAWIGQSSARAAANISRTIRLPVHVVAEAGPVLKFVAAYRERWDLDPLHHEVVEGTGLPGGQVAEALELPEVVSDLRSPEAVRAVKESAKSEVSQDESEDALLRRELRGVMFELLTATQRYVIAERFGFDDRPERTLDEVARDLGLTRERVRQIQSRSVEALRMARSRLWLP